MYTIMGATKAVSLQTPTRLRRHCNARAQSASRRSFHRARKSCGTSDKPMLGERNSSLFEGQPAMLVSITKSGD